MRPLDPSVDDVFMALLWWVAACFLGMLAATL